MTLIIQSMILGIMTGSVYALMSSGLTLVFGVMEIVNVAQGIMVILGAYLSYFVEQNLHIDLFLSLLITMPLMFILGIGIEWAFVRRVRKQRIVLSILVVYAVALIIEGILDIAFTSSYVTLSAPYIDASFPFISFRLGLVDILNFILSIVLLSLLYLLVYRTRFGDSLQASMQNRTAAALVGINVEKVQAITFGIGIALAAAGGIAYGATNSFNAASAYDLVSRLLTIVVLGGMGSLRGAFVASLVMLVTGDLVAVIWSPVWSSTVFNVTLMALLIFRPQGLFGRLEGRKQ